MQTTYRLNTKELNETVIRSIQDVFGNREIELTVTDVEDETEYLLKSPLNREHLLKAVRDFDDGAQLVEVSLEK